MKANRRNLYAQAQGLANERATVFRLARRNRAGELLTGHRLHMADTARKRNNLIAKGARPVLSSSQWRALYEEVGLA